MSNQKLFKTVAVYQGKEFKFRRVTKDIFQLRSNNAEDKRLGFLKKSAESKHIFAYEKNVPNEEIECAFHEITYADYKDFKFQVREIDESNSRVLIASYVITEKKADKLGLQRFCEEGYQKWIPKSEAQRIYKEKHYIEY